jgi:predicted dehydrogenase
MTTARPLSWGIAGFGWVAQDYVAPAIRAARDARLVAVCDPDPAARARAGDAASYADMDAFLAHPGLDAVYVAAPNHLHRRLVEATARAGKHVLCEKPMATSLADAEAMGDACRRTGIRYATAFDQRFHPAHRRIREAIAAGAIGTATAVRIVYCCWVGAGWSADNWRVDAARSGGGAMIDLAPHGLDLVGFLLGEPLVDIAALAQRRVQDYAVDDGAVIVGRSATGALAQLHVSYNCPETLPRRRLEIVGSRGQIVAIDTMGQTAGGTVTLTDVATGEARPLEFDRDRSPFIGLVEGFTRDTLAGAPDAIERDLHTMRLLDRLAVAVADMPAAPPAADPELAAACR